MGDACDDLARLFLDHDDEAAASGDHVADVMAHDLVLNASVAPPPAASAPPVTTTAPAPPCSGAVMTPTAPPIRTPGRTGPSMVVAEPVPGTRSDEPLDIGVDPSLLRPSGRAPFTRDVMSSTIAAPETVDVLLAGHLPRPAAMWGHQAVAAIARREGPVAMVQAEGDLSATLRLFQATREITSAEIEQGGPTDTLRNAYANLERFRPRWVVGLKNEGEIVDLFNLPVRRVVYITCADRLAMVGAYKAIKKVRAMTGETAEIALIVVGESEKRARGVHERLALVAERFLNQRVDLLAVVPRISPICGLDVGRFEVDGDFSDWVDTHLGFDEPEPLTDPLRLCDVKMEPLNDEEQAALIRPLLPTHVVEHEHDDVMTIESSVEAEMEPERERLRVSEPVSVPARPSTPRPVTPPPPPPLPPIAMDSTVATSAATPADDVPDEVVVEVPAGEAPVVARTAAPTGSPDLAALLPDVSAMRATCPWAPAVAFGLGRDGSVHAMIMDQGESSVSDLQAACEWAHEHHAMITALHPRVTRAALTSIQTHLFTREPKARRHWLLSPNLRVHLLKSLREVRETTDAWVHVELN